MIRITKIMILTMFALFALVACSSSAPEAAPPTLAVTTVDSPPAEPEPTVPPTAIPTQTSMPDPTATVEVPPTATLEPTDIPEPTPTPDLTGGGSGKIVFTSSRDGEETFYIMNYDGSEQDVWVDNPIPGAVSRSAPRYSPDGSQIVISAEEGGSRNIFVANADGSDWRQITTYTDPIVGSNPTWSPDGSQIVFSSNEDNGIHVINSDGSGHVSLLEDPTGIKSFPSWSPDGDKIVFNWSYYDADAAVLEDAEIVVMNADGTAVTPLTENEFQDIGAAWSPDGTKIAFQSNRDGQFEIYVMNADGSGQMRLTNNGADNFSPVWSPDGSLIAYSAQFRDEDGTIQNQVYVVGSDGTNERNLTNGQNGFNPYWLP